MDIEVPSRKRKIERLAIDEVSTLDSRHIEKAVEKAIDKYLVFPWETSENTPSRFVLHPQNFRPLAQRSRPIGIPVQIGSR
jgi:hypothetical protein